MPPPPTSYNSISLGALASVLKTRAEAALQDGTKVKGAKIALLLGAGASVSAGIPLARDIVREVREKFGQLVAECKPTYTEYMAKLASADRTNLLRKYLDSAAVNATHLYLAQLVKAGYVDRILTTNFDSLAVQALVLVNERPFVYDLANLKIFKPGQVASPAVIHLHGQFGGFVNMHADEEFQKLGSLVHDVLSDTISQRALIVVGYGGLNDPVFEQLSLYGEKYGEYDNGLYWVSNRDAEPPDHVFSGLLQDVTRKAYYLRGYDADSFFMNLVSALECAPPQIVLKPFTFLKDVVRLIGNFRPNGNSEDPISGTRKLIEYAIECHEMEGLCPKGTARFEARKRAMIEKQAQDIWQEKRIKEIDRLLAEAQIHKANNAIDWLARTLEDNAVHLLKMARQQSARKSAETAEEALLQFRRAEEIRPASQEALLSRAEELVLLTRTAGNWRQLFSAAFDNYRRATHFETTDPPAIFPHDGGVAEIETDPPVPKHVPRGHLSWGEALESMAARLRGDERIATLEEAASQYQAALGLQPNWQEPLERLFSILLRKAQVEPSERRKQTLNQATQILGRASAAFRDTHQNALNAAYQQLETSVTA